MRYKTIIYLFSYAAFIKLLKISLKNCTCWLWLYCMLKSLVFDKSFLSFISAQLRGKSCGKDRDTLHPWWVKSSEMLWLLFVLKMSTLPKWFFNSPWILANSLSPGSFWYHCFSSLLVIVSCYEEQTLVITSGHFEYALFFSNKGLTFQY